MLKSLVSLVLLVSATDVWAASNTTDFGIRTIGVPTISGQMTTVVTNSTSKALLVSSNLSPLRAGVNLRAAAALGSQWGRVTSMVRSVAHNRAVGGVRNSWHLRGRAIDIARRPGVTHSQIAAAFRNAGYYLVESLDEGDHSHFAFAGSGTGTASPARTARTISAPATQWKIVTVANAAFR